MADEPAAAGDLLVRDRLGNWTYGFCVVVDDLRHGVDLVIRGRDLLDATPVQLRLGFLLGREHRLVPPSPAGPPTDGEKLSKSEGATSVRSLLAAGRTPAELFGEAAAAVGLIDAPRPVPVERLADLFG